MNKKPCQRRCIDDMCRGGGDTLCGQNFCESCGKACMFDEFTCERCREDFEECPKCFADTRDCVCDR